MPRQPASHWKPLLSQKPADSETLPGKKGTWVLYLEHPLVQAPAGSGHCVLFSWQDQSFKIRDFIKKSWRQQGPDLRTPQEVWAKARRRIPCHGDLRKP